MDEQLAELCRCAKVSDYLRSRGVSLVATRRGFRCICPLPGHKDDTPSFNITTMPDGAEVYKCFGCSRGGGIITLIHEIEGIQKGAVVRRLSTAHGVKVGDFKKIDRFDPLGDDILSKFCEEDQQVVLISEMAINFMEINNGSEDAINQVVKVYKRMDDLVDKGDWRGVRDLRVKFKNIINQYRRY
jgi:hypothetical protein